MKTHELSGTEKEGYLQTLDLYLQTLIERFPTQSHELTHDRLHDFGKRHDWDFTRILPVETVPEDIVSQLEKVKETYSFLRMIRDQPDSLDNRGVVDKISIQPDAGLPWNFDLRVPHRHKQNHVQELAKIPTYENIAKRLGEMYVSDTTSVEELGPKSEGLVLEALARNHFEQIKDADILGVSPADRVVETELRGNVGYEQLWRVSTVTYSAATAMFHVAILDAWQDEEKAIISRSGISPELSHTLQTSEVNRADYLLRKVDESYESLHPVHVSRFLIGPFDNKYKTKAGEFPILAESKEILRENDDAMILRCSHDYTYAPNTVKDGEKKRQETYRETWNDYYVVCPAEHSQKMSRSLRGGRVFVYEV